MGDQDKPSSSVEPDQKKSPEEGAKDAVEPPANAEKDNEQAMSPKAQKNQFALNRLVLMLMDIDPADMAPKMIDGLTKVHQILDGILKRQSGEMAN